MTGSADLPERRRLWIVAAVAAVMLVVAVTARAGEDGGRARSAEGVVGAIAPVLRVAALVYVVVMLGVIAWAWFADGGRLEGRRRPVWPTIAALLVAIVVASLLDELRSVTTDAAGRGGTVEGGDEPDDDQSEPDRGNGGGGWLLAAVGVIVVGATALTLRNRARLTAAAESLSAPTSPADVDDAVSRARACRDPRQAVLLAFAAAESVLAADAATRRPPVTSAREWASAVASPALTRIVGRYEVARFSDHEVTEHDRAEALDALDALA